MSWHKLHLIFEIIVANEKKFIGMKTTCQMQIGTAELCFE
jgi:hypothetical protein